MNDYNGYEEDDSDWNIHDVVNVARQDPQHFLDLVNRFCSPETKRNAVRSMQAWGIETRPYIDESSSNRPARFRKDKRNH